MTPHKTIAVQFQTLVIQGKIREAYERYIHPDFTHHNPYIAGDRDSLMKAMEENAKAFPEKVYVPHTIIEEGDIVAVHSSITLRKGMPEIAAAHIFRFQDHMIIEEWDISQQVPEDSQNMLGMF